MSPSLYNFESCFVRFSQITGWLAFPRTAFQGTKMEADGLDVASGATQCDFHCGLVIRSVAEASAAAKGEEADSTFQWVEWQSFYSHR